MASHNVYTFFSVWNCLDEDFDAPDEGDREVCRAIVTGRMGLHPDGWDTRSALTAVMPQGFNGYEWVPAPYRRPIARSTAVEEPRPKPQPRPVWHWVAPADRVQPLPRGEVQLTCDVCDRARFHITLEYHGDRSMKVAAIRVMGRTAGWTCIAGTDRCPKCSQAAAPKPVGNGAGCDQGHEQHR